MTVTWAVLGCLIILRILDPICKIFWLFHKPANLHPGTKLGMEDFWLASSNAGRSRETPLCSTAVCFLCVTVSYFQNVGAAEPNEVVLLVCQQKLSLKWYIKYCSL